MEAGGQHPMSLRRRFSTALAATLMLACPVVLTSVAHAAVTLPEAPNATVAVLDAVHSVTEPVTAAVAPPSVQQAAQQAVDKPSPIPTVQPSATPPAVATVRPAAVHPVGAVAAASP
ncbi:MAG TPA: hypothetical protein VGO83_10720, partial [Thermoleophilaceae bacterium]|nr:hypothetical protein [Thermoleophilaceae bacterium]